MAENKTELVGVNLHNEPHYSPPVRAAADPSGRVRFGSEPHQALDLAVAELLLTRLCAEQPTLFARTLGAVMVGDDATATAARATRTLR